MVGEVPVAEATAELVDLVVGRICKLHDGIATTTVEEVLLGGEIEAMIWSLTTTTSMWVPDSICRAGSIIRTARGQNQHRHHYPPGIEIGSVNGIERIVMTIETKIANDMAEMSVEETDIQVREGSATMTSADDK